ncbi:hypothetical protein LTR50_007046 [Elasticomyces elasticus]|nr:hypothetical protein LTR50_007046 [Elasticomyces elasticus]
MARTIQDSDNEDDFESPPKRDLVLADPQNPTNASQTMTSSDQPGTSSTGNIQSYSSPPLLLTSTEILKRQLQEAHRALVEESQNAKKTQIATTGIEEVSNPPLSNRASKRRKTTSSLNHSPSPPKKAQRTITIKTYGSKDVQNSGETLKSGFVASISAQAGSRRAERLGSGAAACNSDQRLPWEQPDMLGSDFAAHDPHFMFPDRSSTVPDNTMTQQRLVEEALSLKRSFGIGRAGHTENTLPTSSSGPWSTSVDTPPEGTSSTRSLRSKRRSPTKIVTEDEDLHDFAESLCDQDQNTHHEDYPRPSQQEESSRQTRAAPSADSPLKRKRIEELSASKVLQSEKNSVQGIKVLEQNLAEAVQSELKVDDARVVGTETVARTEESVQGTLRTKKRKIQEDFGIDELNSDDRAIGLPKERYNARPSRSRSIQVVGDPVDYSIVPGRSARVKRRKTASTTSVGSPEMEKVTVLTEMGFTASRSKQALRESKGNVEAAVESLSSPSKARKHSARTLGSPASSHSRTRTARTTTLDTEGSTQVKRSRMALELEDFNPAGRKEAFPEDLPPLKGQDASPKDGSHTFAVSTESTQQETGSVHAELQHVEITVARQAPEPPSAKNKTKSSRAKRSKTTIFEDHIGLEHMSPSQNLQQQQAIRKTALESDSKSTQRLEATQKKRRSMPQDDVINKLGDEGQEEPVQELPKKRGRGRPKSTQKAPETSEQGAGNVERAASPSAKEDGVLQEIENDTSGRPPPPPDSDPSPNQTLPPNTSEEAATTPSKLNDGLPRATLSTALLEDPQDAPQKAVSKPLDPTLHSPIKGGKVPYRVGLSKRQRIQPLLRALKK